MIPAKLRPYQGLDQFGKAYRAMLDGDSHAPGSVDRVLAEQMVGLCNETAEFLYQRFTPTSVSYRQGTRPQLERIAERWSAPGTDAESVVAGVAEFCSQIGRGADNDDLDAVIVGGTEEEIIDRRFDWCTDVARVGCILCQVASVPARLVNLADTGRAYSGHVLIEAFRGGTWGTVDTSTNVVYRQADGRPATTWQLMNEPSCIEACGRGKCYSTPGQFRAACIANYPVADHRRYTYTTSKVNAYYRSILEESARGWPGGLRWLHGEDRP